MKGSGPEVRVLYLIHGMGTGGVERSVVDHFLTFPTVEYRSRLSAWLGAQKVSRAR